MRPGKLKRRGQPRRSGCGLETRIDGFGIRVPNLPLARVTPSFTQRQNQQAGHARNRAGYCGADGDVIRAERVVREHGVDETASEYAKHGKEAGTHGLIIACRRMVGGFICFMLANRDALLAVPVARDPIRLFT
jgi:hypothetical protein